MGLKIVNSDIKRGHQDRNVLTGDSLFAANALGRLAANAFCRITLNKGQDVSRLPRLFDSLLSLNLAPAPVKEDRTREQKRAIFSYNIHYDLISQHLIPLRQPEAK